MIAQPRPLIEVFADIPDCRKSRGQRHPFSAMLALSCCALLCGYRSDRAIAAWGRTDGTQIAQALGFRHHTPCAATVHTIFRHIDRDDVATKLGAWAQSVAAWTAPDPTVDEAAVALDGKTLRGSKKHGADGTPLLSAVSHHLGVPRIQQAVDDTTNEVTQVEAVLDQVMMDKRICTMDALLTQRHVAQAIGDSGGEYVMIGKENQPKFRDDIEFVFTLPPAGDRQESARTVAIGQGRIEQRHLTTSEALVGYSDWPGLAQVFALGRYVITQKTQKERVEVVYGVTSLGPQRGTPERLLDLSRGHWHIEHKAHWVRDVTFDEDRSQVRGGNIPQGMAALRHTAMGLLRWAGHTNIAAACRRMAAQPAQALALIGIAWEN